MKQISYVARLLYTFVADRSGSRRPPLDPLKANKLLKVKGLPARRAVLEGC
jgi:hypothetical protein